MSTSTTAGANDGSSGDQRFHRGDGQSSRRRKTSVGDECRRAQRIDTLACRLCASRTGDAGALHDERACRGGGFRPIVVGRNVESLALPIAIAVASIDIDVDVRRRVA
ncbi:MAG TPA: hypothetical protein VNE58_16135 [Casimicrobiaceae bacterium]|nr:hypothetical protein [Casimicrobiaceae bacterium]